MVPSNAQELAPSLLHRPAGSPPPMPSLTERRTPGSLGPRPWFRDTQGRGGGPPAGLGVPCQFTVRTPRGDVGRRLLSSEKHLNDGPTLSPQQKMSKSSVNRREGSRGGSVRSGTDLVLGSAEVSRLRLRDTGFQQTGLQADGQTACNPSPPPPPPRTRSLQGPATEDPVPRRNRKTKGAGQVPEGSTQCFFL